MGKITTLSKTIIIPTFSRPVLLKRCLDSIFSQTKEFEDIEVIVIVNGPDKVSLEVLKNYNVIIVSTIGVTPSEARNTGIKIAKGEILGFLDDDVELGENYFINLEILLKKYPRADVFGGPDQTFPLANNWEKVIGLTLTSPLATAKTNYRHLKGEIELCNANEEHLILCNLWIRRAIFEKEKFSFDHRLVRNEENVLLLQLKKANKQLIYSQNLFVFHHRKGNLKSLCKAVASSGFYRSLSFYHYPSQISIHYIIPAIFVIYLLSLLLLMFFLSLKIILLPLFLYVILNVLISFGISFNNKSFKYFPGIIFTQFIINVSYGVGFIYGLNKIIFQYLLMKSTRRKLLGLF